MKTIEDKKVIVLAFSGGLDTTYCLYALLQQGHEVHTVFVDAGGISADQVKAIKDKALSMGASEHHCFDIKQQVWNDFVTPLLWSHAKVNGAYPLLCSDRYLIVKKCLQLCDQLDTLYFAHGCTAMGNDQLRFDQTVASLGNYQIIAPIRDLPSQVNHVRDHEMAVLSAAGIDVDSSHQKYSINENMLGVTISGSEIDDFLAPTEDANAWVKKRAKWPQKPLSITLTFQKGCVTSLNGEEMDGVSIMETLNPMLAAYGIGRHIYTGDVSIGIKGRIVFECPAIDALMTAHQALQDAVNSSLQNQFHQMIASRWAELLYNGFYHDPHKLDLEAYLASSQSHVSGTVTLHSEGGRVIASAIDSEWIVQDHNTVYAQSCAWSAADALGFIKLIGQPTTLVNKTRRRVGHD